MNKKDKELVGAIYKCSEIRYELLKLELERERAARKRLERLVLDYIEKGCELDTATDDLLTEIVGRIKKLEDRDAER